MERLLVVVSSQRTSVAGKPFPKVRLTSLKGASMMSGTAHRSIVILLVSSIVVAGSLTADDQVADQTTQTSAARAKVSIAPELLDPSLATERAPDSYRVKLETTKGDVIILVNRSWAPNGADRFYNLVRIGYYDDVAFYRVIRGFMAQCGFSPDPTVSAAWARATIPDDPMTQANTRGMVTFAQPAMANARTTQFFINVADNSYLEKHGSFAPFGKVISGMDVVDSFYAGYGEGAPRGRGPSQPRIANEGNSYLRESFPELDYIRHATIVESEAEAAD
jgi:peptidyl-prolyl cis-trans isomerase A (cyclophilin A)